MDENQEQIKETKESQVIESVLDEETSKETEPVSTEETSEEEKPITFKSQVELDKKVKSLAQGMKDKELKTVYEQLRKAQGEKDALERKFIDRTEDSKLSKLEAAELAENGDTSEVRTLQEVRREVIAQGRAHRDKEAKLNVKEAQLLEVGLRQNAFEKALKLFLPENKDFLSEINAFAQKLQEAKTEKEMELTYELEEEKRKAQAEEPEKRHKPDSGVPVTSGGVDKSKLSGRELIERGLKKK